MTESFLILHGLGNHRPPQHWEFLLAAKLVELGHDVRYPELPNSDAPQLDEWMRVLREELGTLTGSRRTVICHSLSCLLWFHAAGRVDAVDRVLLVVPPESSIVPENASTFWVTSVDVDAIRASTVELAIVCTDNDWFNPSGPGFYCDPLGVTPTIIPGAGHITPDDGYGSWPWVLEWALSAS